MNYGSNDISSEVAQKASFRGRVECCAVWSEWHGCWNEKESSRLVRRHLTEIVERLLEQA